MSERMKKLPTEPIETMVEIIVHDKEDSRFVLPQRSFKEVMKLLKPYRADNPDDELVPADEVFKDVYAKYGKVGATIRGGRARDGLTQVALAEKLGIKQSHVSQMEHGKRVIGKKMAQKLAKIFNTDYRLFL